MGSPQPPPFSPLVLLTLLVVAGASSVTFWMLVRRWTSRRQWVALSEWTRETGFRFDRDPEGRPPAPFAALSNVKPVVRMQLSRGPTTLAQLEAEGVVQAPVLDVPAVAAGPASPAAPAAAAPVLRTHTWNLLIRRIETNWRPTGLRPTHATSSVLDLFSLSSYPLMGSTERFTAFGTDSAAARAVSKSMLRSLLPADVGLLLHGPHLVLDFSGRPFDAIELTRMRVLADQLVAHLPPAL